MMQEQNRKKNLVNFKSNYLNIVAKTLEVFFLTKVGYLDNYYDINKLYIFSVVKRSASTS